MRTVHVVVPAGVDDPTRPSGGNVYDRRVCDGLAALGWSVHEHAVPGAWPVPEWPVRARLARVVDELPDGATLLVDGMVAAAAADVLVPAARRTRLCVLAHMPWDGPDECAVLSAASAVLTPSRWARSWLLAHYPLDGTAVHVSEPGVDPADAVPGSPGGGALLCVASVTPGKGHDTLLGALAEVADLRWHCVCVGSLARDPEHVERLRSSSRAAGLDGRVYLAGPRTGAELEAAYAAADVLVLGTRAESYGMVVAEALAHGLPVIATAVGGVPEALGALPDGTVPGLLVPPDDPPALAAALRRWLTDPGTRSSLRAAARCRRDELAGWSVTAERVARVLTEVAR